MLKAYRNELFAIGLVLVLYLIAAGTRLSVYSVWDDAFMFIRYADNILRDGVIAWNPGGEPTYGATSLLYLLAVVVPIRVVVDNIALAILLASFSMGAVFLVLIMVLIARHIAAPTQIRLALMMVAIVILTFHIERVSTHFVSGMDTTFDMALLTLYLISAKTFEQKRGWVQTVAVGVIGGLLYLARPELLLYALAVPTCVWLFDSHARRGAVIMAGVTVAVVVSTILWAWQVLGSPLPLPFYAKSVGIYGFAFESFFADAAWTQFLAFLFTHWWFIAPLALELGLRRWHGWREMSPVNRGVLLATIACYGYLLTVTQVMGIIQRFYYPTLPALIFLGCSSVATLVSQWQVGRGTVIPRSLLRGGAGMAGLFALSAFGLLYGIFFPRTFNLDVESYGRANRTCFGMVALATLPNDVVLGATEVGLFSVLNQDKVMIDLAGLNHTRIAHEGFSADALFHEDQVDALCMPPAVYQEMRTLISTHPYFVENFDYYEGATLGVDLDFAINKQSEHYEALHNLVQAAVRQ